MCSFVVVLLFPKSPRPSLSTNPADSAESDPFPLFEVRGFPKFPCPCQTNPRNLHHVFQMSCTPDGPNNLLTKPCGWSLMAEADWDKSQGLFVCIFA